MDEKEALINKHHAIELFKKQAARIEDLKDLEYDDPEVQIWHGFNKEFIKKIFGEAHLYLIRYFSLEIEGSIHANMPKSEKQQDFLKSLKSIRDLLNEMIEKVRIMN